MSADFVPVALKAGVVNNPPYDEEGRLYREIGRSKVLPQGICVINSACKVLAWTAFMAAIAEGLSESMMPAALGLAIAITALWGYKCLSIQMEKFQTEMRNAIFDLTDYLASRHH